MDFGNPNLSTRDSSQSSKPISLASWLQRSLLSEKKSEDRLNESDPPLMKWSDLMYVF